MSPEPPVSNVPALSPIPVGTVGVHFGDIAEDYGRNFSTIASVTWSMRSGHNSAYTSSVTFALEWPRTVCSVFGSQPEAIAMLAYEWRSACTVIRRFGPSLIPAAARAGCQIFWDHDEMPIRPSRWRTGIRPGPFRRSARAGLPSGIGGRTPLRTPLAMRENACIRIVARVRGYAENARKR